MPIMVILSNSLFIHSFIYIWLCWVFIAVHVLSLICSKQGLLFVAVHRLLIAVAFVVHLHSRASGIVAPGL